MREPSETDLLESLRDANPVDADSLPPSRLADIRARVLENAMPATGRQAERAPIVWRRRLLGLGLGGAVAGLAFALVLGSGRLLPGATPASSLSGGVAAGSSNDGGGAPGRSDAGGASPGSSSAGGVASCVYLYSIDRLADREWAFDGTFTGGTPTEGFGDQVRFRVNEWFRGSGNGSVSLLAIGGGGSDITWEGGPTLGVGQRYLVAGEDRFLWGCGYTQPYDASVAAAWRVALGD